MKTQRTNEWIWRPSKREKEKKEKERNMADNEKGKKMAKTLRFHRSLAAIHHVTSPGDQSHHRPLRPHLFLSFSLCALGKFNLNKLNLPTKLRKSVRNFLSFLFSFFFFWVDVVLFRWRGIAVGENIDAKFQCNRNETNSTFYR